MKQIINGKLYDTETADIVASDHYWDGSNWDRKGRNEFLYKTKKGQYFIYRTTRWQGERDSITLVTKEEAMAAYETLPEHDMDYEAAFGVAPEEG